MTETVFCTDIGTTSLKAALITAGGEVVSFSSAVFENPEDRYIAGTWFEKFKITLQECLKNLNSDDFKVSALSISGNGPTLVCDSGLTVRWNEKPEHYGVKENTGSSLFLPGILLFKKLFSDDFNSSQYIFSGPEYLIYRFTGRACTVLPEKRFISAYWDKDLLKSFDLNEKKFPPFTGIGQVCGYLTKESSEFLNIKEGIPVFSGGPDFTAALIGTKTLKPFCICDRCGSSEGFNFCIPECIKEEGMRSLPSVIPGLWNLSVLLPESSSLSEEERVYSAKNAIYRLREVAKKNYFDFPDKIIVTGGQAKNRDFMTRKAKELGIKLVSCQCEDAELLGNACTAFYGLKIYSSLAEAAENIVREKTVYDNL